MNHGKVYADLMTKYALSEKSKGTEWHHVIPRSIGGDDSKENTVHLPLRAHYIAHLLLVKMATEPKDQWKMMHALKMMSKTRKNVKCNARVYESFKQKYYSAKTHYIVNHNTQEQRRIFVDDPIPEGFVRGGIKKSEEHKAKIGKGNTGKLKPKMAEENRGKKFYTNPDDPLDTVLCRPENAPEGWSQGIKKLSGERGCFYTNLETQDLVMVYDGEEPPEGYVKGNRTDRQLRIGRNNVKKMQTADANEKRKKSKKGKRPWYNAELDDEKWFRDDELPPEGYVKGKSPKHVGRGFKQSNKQKKIATQIFQKSFEVIWTNGDKETVTGIGDFAKSIGLTQSKFDYKRKLGRLHEFGIDEFRELPKS